MDIIERDKQLRTIFEGILKRYQALAEVQPEQITIELVGGVSNV